MSVQVDDGPTTRSPTALVVIANGRYFGGGMHIAPEAVMDDGVFDVIIGHKTSLANNARTLVAIYRGQHLKLPWVTMRRGRTVTLEGEAVYLELDGETPGRLPMTVTVIPRGVTIRVD